MKKTLGSLLAAATLAFGCVEVSKAQSNQNNVSFWTNANTEIASSYIRRGGNFNPNEGYTHLLNAQVGAHIPKINTNISVTSINSFALGNSKDPKYKQLINALSASVSKPVNSSINANVGIMYMYLGEDFGKMPAIETFAGVRYSKNNNSISLNIGKGGKNVGGLIGQLRFNTQAEIKKQKINLTTALSGRKNFFGKSNEPLRALEIGANTNLYSKNNVSININAIYNVGLVESSQNKLFGGVSINYSK